MLTKITLQFAYSEHPRSKCNRKNEVERKKKKEMKGVKKSYRMKHLFCCFVHSIKERNCSLGSCSTIADLSTAICNQLDADSDRTLSPSLAKAIMLTGKGSWDMPELLVFIVVSTIELFYWLFRVVCSVLHFWKSQTLIEMIKNTDSGLFKWRFDTLDFLDSSFQIFAFQCIADYDLFIN